MPRRAIRCGTPLLALVLIAASAAPVVAQRTHDESRLVVGITGGWIGGRSLWRVPKQPFVTEFIGETDTVGLSRSLGSNITLGVQGVYFPSPHIGYVGELTYMGMGLVDACKILYTQGSALTSGACNQLNGLNRSASATALMGGIYLRPLSHTAYQPYLKVLAGAALVPRSTANVDVAFGPNLDSIIDFYVHTGAKQARLAGGLSFGVATAPSNGYQLRLELRQTWVQLPIITGPTLYQGLEPPTKHAWKGLTSFTVGIDIVLERRRGRRY